MGEINGVSFENWAAAAAHLAQGMNEEQVCDILGIEIPVWQDTNEQWMGKLGDLMAEDMSVATTYGDIFANPKVGKFAGESDATPSLEQVLQKAPDYDAYRKIFWQQSIAAEHGIDAVTVIEQYGLTLQNWGQLNMHYIKWHNEFSEQGKGTPLEKERYDYLMEVDNKWQSYWREFYKDNAVNLSDDISF